MFIFSKENAQNYLLPEFVINTFLDTNILVYLVDNSHETLSQAVNILQDCMFASLISSTYVIFEFVGVRKQEHYLREVFFKSLKKDDKGQVLLDGLNLSTLLKFKGDFNSALVDYNTVKEKIKSTVDIEVERVVRDFGIEYDTHKIHNNLFPPVKDLLLSTKISKEDSFVLCSAFWPDDETQTKNLLLLTNDKGFVESYSVAQLDSFFTDYVLPIPAVYAVNSIKVGGGHLNLTDQLAEASLRTQLITVIIEELIRHNKLVGKTRTVPRSAPDNIVCFDIEPNLVLPANLILVLIAKDLSFCFITEHPVQSIQDSGVDITFPYSSPIGKGLCMALDLQREELDRCYGTHHETAITVLRQPGHLLFLHPDL